MIELTYILLVVFTILIVYAFIKANKKPKYYPPGPFVVPLFGYLPFMNTNTAGEILSKLATEYGDAFSLNLGVRNIVYINSWDLAEEALNHPDIAGRPDFYTYVLLTKKQGIGFSEGELFREHSNFVWRHLRSFGFGKRSFEGAIMKEVKAVSKIFAETGEKAFAITHSLNIAISNILWEVIADIELDRNSPAFLEISKNLAETESKLGYTIIADFLPWIGALLPDSVLGVNCIKNYITLLRKFSQGIIKSHKENFDETNLKDFIDVFIKRQREDEENGVKNSTFTDLQLCQIISDLFMVGSETVSTALGFAFHFLICRPDIQNKLRADIYKITKGKRAVTLEDRNDLQYLQAFVLELLRLANIAPLITPHRVTSTVKIGNYVLPKDTLVVVQARHIHLNPTIWPNPDEFDATRFLDEDGNLKKKSKGYLPLSFGKRLCPGESFSKTELFLFLGNLLQDFTFSSPPGVTQPPTFAKGACGLVIHPPPFEMIAKPLIM